MGAVHRASQLRSWHTAIEGGALTRLFRYPGPFLPTVLADLSKSLLAQDVDSHAKDSGGFGANGAKPTSKERTQNFFTAMHDSEQPIDERIMVAFPQPQAQSHLHTEMDL